MILKTFSKSVWSNGFLICKNIYILYTVLYALYKFIQYTTHWDKTQKLKKFSSDKISGTKNVLFFLSLAPTHHSSTFNL